MSNDPSFEGLPSSVVSTHTQNLEQLAQRENLREPAIPVIPTHYATSLSELRGLQKAPSVPSVPSVQPITVELDGDLEDITTVTELCERAGALLSTIAEQTNSAQLESLARRLQSVQIRAYGELSILYAQRERDKGASWNAIAEGLNELMLTKSVYKPLRSSSWNSRSIKSLVYLRSRGDE